MMKGFVLDKKVSWTAIFGILIQTVALITFLVRLDQQLIYTTKGMEENKSVIQTIQMDLRQIYMKSAETDAKIGTLSAATHRIEDILAQSRIYRPRKKDD